MKTRALVSTISASEAAPIQNPCTVHGDFVEISVKMKEMKDRTSWTLGTLINVRMNWGIGIMGMGDARSKRRNVAVFLDMENLVGGKTAEATGLRLGELVTAIETIVQKSGVGSKAAVIRAHAHWGSKVMAGFQREMLGLGVEPVQIFSFEKQVKNAADIELCVDVLAVVHESPWIDVFVIATGDGGFVPLVRRLHALEKYVVVVSTNDPESGVVNALLKAVADEYHQVQMSQVDAAIQLQSVRVPEPLIASPANLHRNVPTAVSPKNPKPKQAPNKAKPKQASEKAPKPTAGEQAKAADIKVLRRAILSIIRENPDLVISNRVNAGALGQHLRSEHPQLSYKGCGSKTLGAFLRLHCDLAVVTPRALHISGPTAAMHSA